MSQGCEEEEEGLTPTALLVTEGLSGVGHGSLRHESLRSDSGPTVLTE